MDHINYIRIQIKINGYAFKEEAVMSFLRPVSIGIYFKGKEFAPLDENSFVLSIDPFLEGLRPPEKAIRESRKSCLFVEMVVNMAKIYGNAPHSLLLTDSINISHTILASLF